MVEESTTKARFDELFGSPPALIQFIPGRVNLIGEHIDYNGGMVLPKALPLGVTLALGKSKSDGINIHASDFKAGIERGLDEGQKDHWSDYVLGAFRLADEAWQTGSGYNLYISSNLPIGAGVSSSAATIVAILKALRKLHGIEVADIEIAQLAQRVECEFIGMPCGIMDQMAVAIGTEEASLALDTQTLDYELCDIPEGYRFAIVHSGITRALNEGRYAIRRSECEAAASALNAQYLCQLDEAQREKIEMLPSLLAKRARHCVSEQARVLNAITALKRRDMIAFGNLMVESHVSMRDDFEVSLPEIDHLVEATLELGAMGARLTGGGFGGCIVALLAEGDLPRFSHEIEKALPAVKFIC